LNNRTVIKDKIKALKSVDDSITTNEFDKTNCLNEYFVSVFQKDESLENVSFTNKCENICMVMVMVETRRCEWKLSTDIS
jgi:hypothetical protein